MTDKELKKLRRQDLLELLLAQSKEVEQLKQQLQEAEEKLRDRQIILSQAGSIAEAALQLNGVFAAAEAAAAQWLENIQDLSSGNHEDDVPRERTKETADKRAEAEEHRLTEKDTRRECEQEAAEAVEELDGGCLNE